MYPGALQPAFASRYNFTILAFQDGLPAALAIIAALVGAPLVAREIEQRTQLVSWTQSVSRRRWYVTKVTIVATAVGVAGLVVGVAADQLQRPLGMGGLMRSRWVWFFSMDLALAGEIVLAFALAVALGAWLRRTVPAVGAALACFVQSGLKAICGTSLAHDLLTTGDVHGHGTTPDDTGRHVER